MPALRAPGGTRGARAPGSPGPGAASGPAAGPTGLARGEQELAVAGPGGHRRGDEAEHREPEPFERRPHLVADGRVHRLVAHDAAASDPLAPGLELRLDQRDEMTAPAQASHDGRQNQPERD
mgnify:CR=1 FL=1